MKLLVVDGSGKTIGEVKLNGTLLNRPDVLASRVSDVIRESRVNKRIEIEERIVESSREGILESLDDDTTIMDIPLNLAEACAFDFEKHMDSITGQNPVGLKTEESRGRKQNARYCGRPAYRTR